MELYLKIVLIFVILGVIATGITFGVLCMNKKNKNGYKYPRKVAKQNHENHDQEEEFKPVLVSGSPHLGPIAGEVQQPNCGVIWDNVDVDYGLPVDQSLGPVSPECRAD
jgi:hypothetical protein